MKAKDLRDWLHPQCSRSITLAQFARHSGLDSIDHLRKIFLITGRLSKETEPYKCTSFLEHLTEPLKEHDPSLRLTQEQESMLYDLEFADPQPDYPSLNDTQADPPKRTSKGRKKRNANPYRTPSDLPRLPTADKHIEKVDGGMAPENKGGDIWPVKK